MVVGCVVIFRFCDYLTLSWVPAIWPEEWGRAVEAIAIKSPHLLLGFDYLKRELMHNSVLRDEHVSAQEIYDLRQTLRSLLGSTAELDVFINKLNPTLCVYVLSIYYLEQLRYVVSNK